MPCSAAQAWTEVECGEAEKDVLGCVDGVSRGGSVLFAVPVMSVLVALGAAAVQVGKLGGRVVVARVD